MIVHGDCVEGMAALEPGSIDAVVCDPPYGLEFMGKEWDGADGFRRSLNPADVGRASRTSPEYRAGHAFQEFMQAVAVEALRVLKPGGHLLAFGGTRTYHRLGCAVEDAGFEIRDQLQWLYGQGFPKSRDVGDGWGTALKPAHEPVVMARKPIAAPNVAGNVAAHGTGAINVDGCRIQTQPESPGSTPPSSVDGRRGSMAGPLDRVEYDGTKGRWPANVMLDEDAARMLDEDAGELPRAGGKPSRRNVGADDRDVYRSAWYEDAVHEDAGPLDRGGGPSRFFYCAKASRSERNAGLEAFEKKPILWSSGEQSPGTFQAEGTEKAARNPHPTVKPIELMRWLCRLVTPTGGTVLDPFAGSGSTGCAAALEGFEFLGFELDGDYVKIAEARIAYWSRQPVQQQFGL